MRFAPILPVYIQISFFFCFSLHFLGFLWFFLVGGDSWFFGRVFSWLIFAFFVNFQNFFMIFLVFCFPGFFVLFPMTFVFSMIFSFFPTWVFCFCFFFMILFFPHDFLVYFIFKNFSQYNNLYYLLYIICVTPDELLVYCHIFWKYFRKFSIICPKFCSNLVQNFSKFLKILLLFIQNFSKFAPKFIIIEIVFRLYRTYLKIGGFWNSIFPTNRQKWAYLLARRGLDKGE